MPQRTFIHGFHAVLARLRNHPDSIQVIYLDAGRQDKRANDVRRRAQERGVRCVASEAARLDEMSHGKSQGVVACVEPIRIARCLDEVLEGLTEAALLLVLDGVTDPRNLGACLRSADALGAHAVIAPKDRAAGLGATAIKAASGAADSVPYIPVTNLARTLRELRERGVLVVGTDPRGPLTVADADFSGPTALVLGAEGGGLRRLSREHCDVLVRIPMFGQVESLNVSVCAGVCLYEARRQRGLEEAGG